VPCLLCDSAAGSLRFYDSFISKAYKSGGDFVQTIVGAKNGILPPINWEDHGLTLEAVTDFMSSMTYSVYPDATVEDQPEFYSAAVHFEHVIHELGLKHLSL